MKYCLEHLDQCLKIPSEYESLEFKEARISFSSEKLINYCVAIANEGGGQLILGVSDKKPRQVVGLIKADESETQSTRYAKYVPFWAH